MPNVFILIGVELFKLFRRNTFWIGLVVFAFLIITINLISFLLAPSYSHQPHIPEEAIQSQIDYLENELAREDISQREREMLDAQLEELRLQQEVGYEAAQEILLTKRLHELEKQIADPALTEQTRKELEQQVEVTRMQIKGDEAGIERLYKQWELDDVNDQLAQGGTSPDKEKELLNQKKGLEMELTVIDSGSSRNNDNAFRAMLQILHAMNSFFLPLFISLIAAEQIAGEHAHGTLNLSLIRPVSRIRLFLTRYGALLTTLSLIIAFISVSSFALGGALTTFQGFDELIIVGKQYSEPLRGFSYENASLMPLWQVSLYTLGMLLAIGAAIAAIALFFSAVFRSSFLPVICVLGLIVVGSILQAVPGIGDVYLYLPFIHFNALFHFGEYGTYFAREITPGFSLFLLAAYGALFLAAGSYLFYRKDILS